MGELLHEGINSFYMGTIVSCINNKLSASLRVLVWVWDRGVSTHYSCVIIYGWLYKRYMSQKRSNVQAFQPTDTKQSLVSRCYNVIDRKQEDEQRTLWIGQAM